MANSAERSKVILFDPKAKTEHYQRSNHNDFATASELKERKFSGQRVNKISMENELWVDGEIKARVSAEAEASDPTACVKAQMEVFKLL